MTRQQAREYIERYMDVSGCRFSESDAEKLMEIIDRREELNGKRKTRVRHEYDRYSGGSYCRTIETTYTFVYENGRISILVEEYSEDDDDGQTHLWKNELTSARDILSSFYHLF